MPRPPLGSKFWKLWTATAISGLGDGLLLVALPLLGSRLTDTALLIAGLSVVQRLPWLIAALGAGGLADRIDRGSLLRAVELTRGLALAIVAAIVTADAATLPVLYGCALVLGTSETLFFAASHAVIPTLVPPSELNRANGYLYAAETGGGWFAGPALGGFAFALGAAVPFFADGISFVVSALLLAAAVPRQGSPERPSTSLTSDVLDGLRFFIRHRILRLVAALVSGLAFCQAMVIGVLVIYAQRELGLDEASFGLLVAVGAVGNVAGGIGAGRFHRRVGTGLTVALGGTGAALGYLAIAAWRSPVVAGVALMVESLGVALGNVATLTLRQRLVPIELRGRVGNAVRSCIYGALPIGGAVGGIVTTVWSVRGSILIAGLIQLVVVATMSLPLIRRIAEARADEPIVSEP